MGNIVGLRAANQTFVRPGSPHATAAGPMLPSMRTSTRFLLLLSLSAIVAQGCALYPTDLAPRPVTVPDGTWSGATKLGSAVTFTVRSHVITELTLTYRIAGCTDEMTETVTPSAVIGPSVSGSGFFKHDYTSAATGVRAWIVGSFDTASPPRVTGDFSLAKPGCETSNDTWSARKE